ncbi:hypothetical protein F2Q70_00021006 [Brassica cretica]|uniref:Uncharacterized protein n=1 Tax=Brassica cretica TaxID=69181 RepID=A0A8S9GRU8_BRACR|nr:hypothetical protein F2Q70_00021006 [Brassica cretica]
MSFLGGRLAGKEAAYFFQESKHAVNRIAEKSPPTPTGKKLPPPSPGDIQPDLEKHLQPPLLSSLAQPHWFLERQPQSLTCADDIRTKGKDLFQPNMESMKEKVEPLRTWAETMSRKWHIESNDSTIKEKPIFKELSRILGPKT